MTMQTLKERFEEVPIDVVVFGGERWVRGSQVAEALGFKDPADAAKKMFQRNQREFDETCCIAMEIPTASGRQLTRLYNPRGAALFALKANTPKAEAFRRWVLDVLEGVAEQGPVEAGQMPAGVRHTLTAMFLQRKGNTALVRYRHMGLGPAEIAKLLGVSPSSVNPRLRVAEFLGLTVAPGNLEALRSAASFKALEAGRLRAKRAYAERQKLLAAQSGEATHG